MTGNYILLKIEMRNFVIWGHVQIIQELHQPALKTIFFSSKMRKKPNKQSIASLLIHHNILIHHETVSI